MDYGYVRCSTAQQNEKRQLDAMTALGVPTPNIYIDKQSGKSFDRPAYQRLLKKLKPGDLLYVVSVDRLGRNYEEIKNQWRILTKEMGVDIVVLDMSLLDTRQHKDLMGTFVADLVLQVLSFMGQQELEHIHARQAQGIAAARARGVHLGRPTKPLPENFIPLAKSWAKGDLSTSQLAKQTGLAETTLYRRLRQQKIMRKK